jgi:hypothetical protein
MKSLIYFTSLLLLFSCNSESDKKLLCKEWKVMNYHADISTLGLLLDKRKVDSIYHYPEEDIYKFNTDHTYEYLNLAEPWLIQKGNWEIEYGFKKELILQHDSIKQAFAMMLMDEQNLNLNTTYQNVDFSLGMQPHSSLRSAGEKSILGKWKVQESKIVDPVNKKNYAVLYPQELVYHFNIGNKLLITNVGTSEEGTWEHKRDSLIFKINSAPEMIFKMEVLHASDSLMITGFDRTTYSYMTKVF